MSTSSELSSEVKEIKKLFNMNSRRHWSEKDVRILIGEIDRLRCLLEDANPSNAKSSSKEGSNAT